MMTCDVRFVSPSRDQHINEVGLVSVNMFVENSSINWVVTTTPSGVEFELWNWDGTVRNFHRFVPFEKLQAMLETLPEN